MADLNEVIKTSEVIIHKGRYAYLQGEEKEIKNHFLISKDKDEITIVTEEANISSVNFKKEVKWFKLFEIRVSMPFLAKGFLAKVTKTVSDENLNVLVVSTFSKDYILVREETFETASNALKKVGFPVIFED
jgi:hypothetical protein